MFHRWAVFAVACAISVGVQAFDLFSPERGAQPEVKAEEKAAPPPVVQRPRKPLKTESFVLRGTSRIGSNYYAMLQHPAGEMSIPWRPGTSSDIDGYPGYKLLAVETRSVNIGYPEKGMCIEDDPEKGVFCGAKGETARLVLVRRSPSAAPAPTKSTPSVGGKDTGAPPLNPFQAALEKAKAESGDKAQEGKAEEKEAVGERLRNARKEAFKNFKPKRIDPDDVPAGMKVVHTPFGDRLVPEK